MIEKFRGFQIGERIGSGGMSSIYQGVQTALDRKVAVKVLHPALGDDEQFIQRFEREAKSASSLGHPNVVNIIDFGSESGAYFIVMELVDGHDLRWYFRKCPHFPPEMTLIFLEEICHGLEAAHAKNIVHRDIKPSNVLLSNDGRLAIADFGLARQVGDLERFSAITATGAVLGTPAYMSPEQLAGEDLDHRTDIYSLGVMAYEFFVGERPFKSTTSGVRTADKIKQGDFPTMERNGTPLSPDLVHLVSRMLALDPERRFPSVSGVLDAVQNAMERIDTTGRLLKQRKHYLRRFAQDPVGFSAELLGVEDDPTQFAAAHLIEDSSRPDEPVSFETVPSMDTAPSMDEEDSVSEASDGSGGSGALDSVDTSGSSILSSDSQPGGEGAASTASTDLRGAEDSGPVGEGDSSVEIESVSEPAAKRSPSRAVWAVPLVLSCLILAVVAVPGFLSSGSSDPAEAGNGNDSPKLTGGLGDGAQESGGPGASGEPPSTQSGAAKSVDAASHGSKNEDEISAPDNAAKNGVSKDETAKDPAATNPAATNAAAENVTPKNSAARDVSPKNQDSKTQAAKNETAKADAARIEAAKTDVAKTDVAKTDVAKTGAAKTDSGNNDPAKSRATPSDVATDHAATGGKPSRAVTPSKNRAGDEVVSQRTVPKPKKSGMIEVRVIPLADVYVDGKLIARKSRFVQHETQPNAKHLVEVRHPAFGEHRWSATPAPGDTTRLVHRFHWGDVRIGWLPAGQADVYFDDLLAGGVNGFSRQVSLGEHKVRVRRNGYRIRSVELTDANGTRLLDGPGAAGIFPQYLVDVTSGATVTVNFLFEKE